MPKPPLLDIEDSLALVDYLSASRGLSSGEIALCEPLTGGVSSRTVRVTFRSGESWVVKQSLAKLRVTVDWFSDPKRIQREAAALRTLNDLLPPASVPEFLFEDREHSLLAMKAVAAPHENLKTLWLAGAIDLDHASQLGAWLSKMQRLSHERRAELAPQFAAREFFESLRVEPYYLFSAQQAPEARSFLLAVVDEVRSRRLTLVHGDYSPKNVLVRNGRLVLLDFEVAHWGDPAFDVGFALAHLLSKARHLPQHRTRFAAAALTFWSTLKQELGDVPPARDLELHATRHGLACLLARAIGRSPLEYLLPQERIRQRDDAIMVMQSPPTTIAELIDRMATNA